MFAPIKITIQPEEDEEAQTLPILETSSLLEEEKTNLLISSNLSRKRLSSPKGILPPEIITEGETSKNRHLSPILRETPTIELVRPHVIGLPISRNSRNQIIIQRHRLVVFGSVTIGVSFLLWFSVYHRHGLYGPQDVNDVSEEEEEENQFSSRDPWIILSVVVSFLGIAACYAGLIVKKEEDSNRVRVVRGDSVLGMVAAQGERSNSPTTEPTTPQRVWAIKAIAEMDRL
jgi:hypothetical protein